MKRASVVFFAFCGLFGFSFNEADAQQYYYHPEYGWYLYPPPATPAPPAGQSKPQQRRVPAETTPQPRKARSTPQPQQQAEPLKEFEEVDISGETVPYVWNSAENFSKLAKSCGVSSNQLLALNKLRMSDLRSGQILQVPLTNDPYLKERLASQTQNSREIWRGVRGKKRVALTFDAGASPKHAEELVDNLKAHNIPATFFITGDFAKKHSDIIKKISDSGYRIHNHSWNHPAFTKISDDKIRSELGTTDNLLKEMTDQSSKPFWRPPFGDRDSRVLRVAAEEGYRSVYWTIDSLDSVGEPKDEKFILDRVFQFKGAKGNIDHYLDGAIILMHLGKEGTANVVPELAKKLRERGFKIVTVEEIVKP